VSWPSKTLAPLAQHPHERRPERPILLAVDQQFGEGATLRAAPELSDPVGSLEVGKHQDVEQFGAGSRAEGVKTIPKSPGPMSQRDLPFLSIRSLRTRTPAPTRIFGPEGRPWLERRTRRSAACARRPGAA